MRKIGLLCFCILAFFAVLGSISAYASGFRVRFEGEYIDVVPAIVHDGTSYRSMLPFRQMGEHVGAEVDWCGEARLVTINHGENVILLTIDSPIALINGDEVEMDVPATIIGTSTYVPVRFVGEALGLYIGFYDDTIIIQTRMISLISVTYEVYPGQDVTLAITGRPYTEHSIQVTFHTGHVSTAACLYPKTSDSYGNVYWTFRIGSGTTPGEGNTVLIQDGGESFTTTFTVVPPQ